jgi:hypothetical protein
VAQATIQIQGDANPFLRSLRQVERGLGRLNRSAKRSERALDGINRAAGRISGALTLATTAFAGFVTSRGISGILDATQAMEGFRTQLTTYLGSQELANAELQRLSKLARTLPQDVNQLTEAFVIFNRFGLDTSNESMRAFSNIAAANSKSITQLGEAVADALTGEFERLKEFGIKVSTENGKFTAKIGEDQVAVATSTKDLVEQLKALGEEGGRFGEVTIGPLTLAMSNFRGAIFETAAALGEGGLGLAIADSLTQFTDLITKNDQAVERIGDALTKAFLYAKEAAVFLANNIEILGKALAIVIGISFARWAIGAATAMAAFTKAVAVGAVAALGFLAKGLIRTASLALRHPLIGGIALVIGGIEYFTGALSSLAEKMGLIGDESVMEDLVNQARELGDNIAGPVVGAIEDFSDISGKVNEQFDDIKVRSKEITQSVDETAAAQQMVEKAAEATASAAQAQADAFADILADKQEELRVSQLSKIEQEEIRLIKETERKLGRELLDDEKEKLGLLIRQTAELEEQEKRRKKFVEALGKGLEFQARALPVEADLRELEESLDLAKQVLDNDLKNREISEKQHKQYLLDLERQFQVEKAQLQKRAVENAIRNQVREGEALKGLYSFKISEEQKAVLQKIGNEERVERIVRDRIEFEKKSETEKYQWAIGQAGSALEQLGRYNKQAFEASKALRIAEAIMATYQAATLALATYPPPFGFIGAAVAVAAGLANVAAIRSQSYSGRRFGGSVMEGESYLVGEAGPEIFTPASSGTVTKNSDIGSDKVVNVNFTINAMDTTSFDEMLLNRRGVIQQVIRDAVLETGQRSRF